MHSHTPYTRWVDAQIMYNNFKRNIKLDDGQEPEATSTPTTYTMGIKVSVNPLASNDICHGY